MCWKIGKEYFLDLREECPTGLNEILTSCSHRALQKVQFRSCLVVLLL